MKFLTDTKMLRFMLPVLCTLLLCIPFFSHAEVSWQEELGNYLGNLILSTAAIFTWLGGFMLDYVVLKLVLQMGLFIRGGLDTAINAAWITVRDIANIVFIFGFVYIGIRTIFDYDSAHTKKVLASIIIGALLINFSLFITKVVIDASNLLAVEIYNTLIAPSVANPNCAPECGIAYGVLSALKMSGLYDEPTSPETLANLTAGGQVWFFIMGAIFLLVAAFVFAAAAILLVIRFIALLLIMVFSPVLFAATVFPQTAGFARTLWRRLFSYAFFAPAFLFLIFVSLKVIAGSTILRNNTNFGPALNENVTFDSFGVVMVFVIAMILLILSLIIANKIGIEGGAQAVRIGNNLRRSGQRIAANTVTYLPRKGGGVLTRSVVGGSSKRLLRSYDKWQAKNPEGLTRKIARGTVERDLRSGLEAGTKIKAGLKHSYQENKDYAEASLKRARNAKTAMDRKSSIEQVTKPGAQPTAAEMDSMVKAVKALTADQLKDMDIKILSREDVAVHLSTRQVEDLEKSGKYSEAEMQSIKDSRKNGIIAIATDDTKGSQAVGGQTQRELLAQRGVDEIAKMPAEVFAAPAMARHLTPAMVEAKMRAGVSDAERQSIQNSINAEIANANIAAGKPDNPYTKQWKNWSDRSTFGARMGLNTG